MNWATAIVAAAVLGACASAPRDVVRGAVRLAPGEHAQGTATIEPGAPVVLRLVNSGPGRVDFVVRAGGVELQKGALTESESRLTVVTKTSLVVLLDATAEGATVVRVESEGQRIAFTWDFRR